MIKLTLQLVQEQLSQAPEQLQVEQVLFKKPSMRNPAQNISSVESIDRFTSMAARRRGASGHCEEQPLGLKSEQTYQGDILKLRD
jgi:hypothetical protein